MESVPGAVATGSQLAHDPGSRSHDPVATAPGTDLILKLRHYPKGRPIDATASQLGAKHMGQPSRKPESAASFAFSPLEYWRTL
jgi:hypothetical protein